MPIDRTPVQIQLSDDPVIIEVRRRDDGNWAIVVLEPDLKSWASSRGEAEARARLALPHLIEAYLALTTSVPVSDVRGGS